MIHSNLLLAVGREKFGTMVTNSSFAKKSICKKEYDAQGDELILNINGFSALLSRATDLSWGEHCVILLPDGSHGDPVAHCGCCEPCRESS